MSLQQNRHTFFGCQARSISNTSRHGRSLLKPFDPASFPEGETKKKARTVATAGAARDYRPVTSFTREEKMRRACAYAATMDPAIEGKDGDPRTFRAACNVGHDFDLSVEDTLEALRDWNARCRPPWTEEGL